MQSSCHSSGKSVMLALFRRPMDKIVQMKIFIVSFAIFFYATAFAQDMTQATLSEIISKVSDTVQQQNGTYKFIYKDAILLCMTDESQNRMRIISPVVELFKLSEDELKNALVANFHTALDVKYAISDDILWSVFIHPLKELTKDQVENAIIQVYNARINFGTTYSSTNLIFPGNKKDKKPKEKPLKKTKI